MTRSEQITRIIDNSEDIVPFLKTLSIADGKALLPVLAELRDKYDKRVDKNIKKGYGPWEDYYYPEEHRDLVKLAGVVCADTMTQFRDNISWSIEHVIVSDEVIEKILPWHVPKWFNRVLNASTRMWSLDYEKLLLLVEKKYFEPTDEIIALVFENSACRITKGKDRDRVHTVSFDLLLSNPIALKKHFWLLFEHPTGINNRGSYDKHNWFHFIPKLILQGKLDRHKVIQACLMSCTKDFNSTQTSWYYKLIKEVKPTEEELVQLQQELITCLNSSKSSAINYGLIAIKKILAHPEFNVQSFIQSATFLLSLPTKSIVNRVLIILDKLTKKHPEHIDRIVETAMNALAHDAAPIQIKAGKLIKKHASPTKDNINTISMYQSGFHSETTELLVDYVHIESVNPLVESTEEKVDMPRILTKENEIPTYDNFDDLVFFLTQINDENEHWHLEQLLKIIPTLESKITEANADKLSQAFGQAISHVTTASWGFSNQKNIYSYYINDFAQKIDQKYPGTLKGRNKHIEKISQIHPSYGPPYRSLSESSWNTPISRFRKHLCVYSQSLMNQGLELEILSVPTHLPSWIHPEILVDRILKLEANGHSIDNLDWELAIMRLCPEYEFSNEIENKLEKIKFTVLKETIRYFYGKIPLGQVSDEDMKFFFPAMVLVGTAEEHERCKEFNKESTLVGLHDYHWKFEEVEYLGWTYDKKLKETIRAILTKTVLYIDEYKYVRPTKEEINSARNDVRKISRNIARNISRVDFVRVVKNEGIFDKLKKVFRGDSTDVDRIIEIINPPPTVANNFFDYYDFLSDHNVVDIYNRNAVSLSSWEAKHFLSMVPNKMHMYLSKLVHFYMEDSGLPSTQYTNLVIEALEYLLEGWHNKKEHEITYLFLAASVLTKSKIARQLVAELWIQAVDYDRFDSEKFGRIIGSLLANNYGPLKRLTDLIKSFMINVSTRHDKKLIKMIEQIIIHMSQDPMTGTKKLLEIISELNIKYKQVLTIGFHEKLEPWRSTKSLQKVIKKLNPT